MFELGTNTSQNFAIVETEAAVAESQQGSSRSWAGGRCSHKD